MNGHFPIQAHGPEFRQIGQVIQYKSNNEITIQRLASAEQMEGYDLDAEEKAKRDRRLQNKAAKMQYVLVFRKDGDIRLIPTALDSVIRTIAISENKHGSAVIKIRNQALKDALFEDGYRTALRKYAYYPVRKNKKALEIVKQVISSADNYDTVIRGDIDYDDVLITI